MRLENLLTFFAVAPLLGLGIWLLAADSFAILTPKRGSAAVIALMLLVAGLLFFTWESARTIVLASSALALALLYRDSRAQERTLMKGLAELDREVPQFTQAICLLISSGLTPLKAIDILASRSKSLLALELSKMVSAIRTGDSVSIAIDALLLRANAPGLRRFATTLVVAIERGAPLVPTLVALVRDLQLEAKSGLMRAAGRTEIALMIPVVFILLPISVLFALFPSITQLQQFAL